MLSMDSDPEKVALKLHRQFGHPSAQKLVKLIKNSNFSNPQLEKKIEMVSETCDICARFKKPPPRPVVCVPLASKFNEAVSMDLKVWGASYFLVIVDIATRFCVAKLIRDKQPKTILKSFLLSWISMFGAPQKLLTDNGGEFNNDEMRQVGDSFNIKIMTTAAESPWSNGVCERLNAVIGDIVRKIIADTKCELEVALSWAVSARNALANFSGFSPNQLVFGFNPAIPDIFHNKPPALEQVTLSETVRENLNALHSARQEFLRCESSEKLMRGLRSNLRNTPSETLTNGDSVYYKRNNSSEWHGPGIVIGRDGKQVLVRHGGTYVRVHNCRLTKFVEPISNNNEENVDQAEQETEASASLSDDESEHEERVHVSDHIDAQVSDVQSSREASNESEPNEISEEALQEYAANTELNLPSSNASIARNVNKFKVGQRLQGKSSTGEIISGKIISRAGKSTGKYKNCFNVKQDNDGTIEWINIDDLNEVRFVPENEETVVMFNSNDISEAKENEIRNWQENDVYEEVEDIGQEFLSVRWVITEKCKDNKNFTKARLVARGFEENTFSLRKDSPTCSKESIRVAISIAAARQWDIHSVDVKAAYLQGDKIERELFLKPPPEYYNGNLWKLNKTVYGLCDAARAWYMRVKGELLSLNVQMCSLDPSLFAWYNNGKLEGILCVYVDDFLWAGTKAFEEQVISKVRELFCIGNTESNSFKYIGLNVCSSNGRVSIDQHQYILTLAPIKISQERAVLKLSELSCMEKSEYRALLGQLNWISTNSRPDISFEVCELSVNLKKTTVSDILKLNKLVYRVKQDPLNIVFPKLQEIENCILECYSDASFANLPDGGSQGGFLIFIKDTNGLRCPIYWQSRKVRRVVKSTLSAEALALLDCAETAIYISRMLLELTKMNIKIRCVIDNKSLFDALYSSKSIEDRRLRIDIAVLRDMIDRAEISDVSWVGTSLQLADCLTKRGASTQRLRAAVSGN